MMSVRVMCPTFLVVIGLISAFPVQRQHDDVWNEVAESVGQGACEGDLQKLTLEQRTRCIDEIVASLDMDKDANDIDLLHAAEYAEWQKLDHENNNAVGAKNHVVALTNLKAFVTRMQLEYGPEWKSIISPKPSSKPGFVRSLGENQEMALLHKADPENLSDSAVKKLIADVDNDKKDLDLMDDLAFDALVASVVMPHEAELAQLPVKQLKREIESGTVSASGKRTAKELKGFWEDQRKKNKGPSQVNLKKNKNKSPAQVKPIDNSKELAEKKNLAAKERANARADRNKRNYGPRVVSSGRRV